MRCSIVLFFASHFGCETGAYVPRIFVEALEGRLMLSAVNLHRLNVSSDARFFTPASSIAAKTGVAIAAPAFSVSPFTINLNALKGELNRAPREFTAAAKSPLVL